MLWANFQAKTQPKNKHRRGPVQKNNIQLIGENILINKSARPLNSNKCIKESILMGKRLFPLLTRNKKNISSRDKNSLHKWEKRHSVTAEQPVFLVPKHAKTTFHVTKDSLSSTCHAMIGPGSITLFATSAGNLPACH